MKEQTKVPGFNQLVDLLEQHTFEASERDDFYCKLCNKPRALHRHTGFRPAPESSLAIQIDNSKRER